MDLELSEQKGAFRDQMREFARKAFALLYDYDSLRKETEAAKRLGVLRQLGPPSAPGSDHLQEVHAHARRTGVGLALDVLFRAIGRRRDETVSGEFVDQPVANITRQIRGR